MLCAVAIAACGSAAPSPHHRRTAPLATVGVGVHRLTEGACLSLSAFDAVAAATSVPVACPTWLPARARPTYFTIGPSDPWEIEFRASTMVLDATLPSTQSPPGKLVSQIHLPDGYRVVVRQAGRAVTAAVSGRGKGLIELLRLHGTRRPAHTMTRIAESLTIVAGTFPGARGCAYAALFATMATIHGSVRAACPRWLPAAVSAPTGTAGYGTSVVEFYGPSAGLPHIVFAWTRAATPPGHLAGVAVLNRNHRVPIYLNPGQGQALFSNHYTAVVAASPHGPNFWVSWHQYYDNRRKDLGTLVRIIRSLVPVGS